MLLQYFGPSLSYHLSLRSLIRLFLSGGFTQILLYSSWRPKISFFYVCNHLAEEERAGCFTFIVFLLPFGCLCSICVSSSWCLGLVCDLWLCHLLVILTCFFIVFKIKSQIYKSGNYVSQK